MNTRPIKSDTLPRGGAILVPRNRAGGSTSPVIVDHAVPERTAVRVFPYDGDDVEIAGDDLLNNWSEVVGEDANALRRRYWPESLLSLMVMDNDGRTLQPAETRLGRIFTVTLVGGRIDPASEIIEREQIDVVLADFAAGGVHALEQIRIRHPAVRRLLASESDVPDLKSHIESGLVERWFKKPVPAAQVLEYIALNMGPNGMPPRNR